ncbi:hypothetical protein Aduo_003200 [Ancylostoma duodenale]
MKHLLVFLLVSVVVDLTAAEVACPSSDDKPNPDNESMGVWCTVSRFVNKCKKGVCVALGNKKKCRCEGCSTYDGKTRKSSESVMYL